MTYDEESGVLREFKEVGNRVYARVREAFTGREIWRSRQVYGKEINMHACAFGTIDEFIDYVRKHV